jgi:hypothetical protein
VYRIGYCLTRTTTASFESRFNSCRRGIDGRVLAQAEVTGCMSATPEI